MLGASASPPASGPVKARERKAPAPSGKGTDGLVTPLTWDVYRWSLAILMLVSISRIHQEMPVIAVFRPGLLFTAICLGYALLFPGTLRLSNLSASWPVRTVLGIVGISLVSAVFGLSLGASASFILSSYSRVILFFVLMVTMIRTLGDVRFLIGSYLMGMAVLLWMCYFVFDMQRIGDTWRMFSPNMYDSNDLGTFFALGLPLGLLMAQTSGRWGRILGMTILVATPGTVAMTGSRGGFLGLAAVIVGLFFMFPRVTATRRIGLVVVITAVVAVAAPQGYWAQMSTIFDPEDDYNLTSDSGRLAIWGRSLGYMAQRPVLGVGPANFMRAEWTLSAQASPAFSGQAMVVKAAHNTFVEVGTELGLPALMLWLSVIFGGTIGLVRLRRRMPVSWMEESAERRFLYLACSYLPVSFFGWAVCAFFVSHAYILGFYILTALLGSILIFAHKELKQEAEVTSAPAPRLHGSREFRPATGPPPNRYNSWSRL